jgi:hypothetical protein
METTRRWDGMLVCCDHNKILREINLGEEMVILAHKFRGFSSRVHSFGPEEKQNIMAAGVRNGRIGGERKREREWTFRQTDGH